MKCKYTVYTPGGLAWAIHYDSKLAIESAYRLAKLCSHSVKVAAASENGRYVIFAVNQNRKYKVLKVANRFSINHGSRCLVAGNL